MISQPAKAPKKPSQHLYASNAIEGKHCPSWLYIQLAPSINKALTLAATLLA